MAKSIASSDLAANPILVATISSLTDPRQSRERVGRNCVPQTKCLSDSRFPVATAATRLHLLLHRNDLLLTEAPAIHHPSSLAQIRIRSWTKVPRGIYATHPGCRKDLGHPSYAFPWTMILCTCLVWTCGLLFPCPNPLRLRLLHSVHG